MRKYTLEEVEEAKKECKELRNKLAEKYGVDKSIEPIQKALLEAGCTLDDPDMARWCKIGRIAIYYYSELKGC